MLWVASRALALLAVKRLDKAQIVENQRVDTSTNAGPNTDVRTRGRQAAVCFDNGKPKERQVKLI